MRKWSILLFFFFFQAEDGIRDVAVTGVQTCALPISFATPLAKKPSWTDVLSGQVSRMDLLRVAVRTVSFTSGNQRVRVRGSLKAQYSRASGTANTLLLVASNAPSRRWPIARRPLMRSYPTVTVCAHHPGTLYFSDTYSAIRRCGQVCAATRSSALTQRSQVQPVFAFRAASLRPASVA